MHRLDPAHRPDGGPTLPPSPHQAPHPPSFNQPDTQVPLQLLPGNNLRFFIQLYIAHKCSTGMISLIFHWSKKNTNVDTVSLYEFRFKLGHNCIWGKGVSPHFRESTIQQWQKSGVDQCLDQGGEEGSRRGSAGSRRPTPPSSPLPPTPSTLHKHMFPLPPPP